MLKMVKFPRIALLLVLLSMAFGSCKQSPGPANPNFYGMITNVDENLG